MVRPSTGPISIAPLGRCSGTVLLTGPTGSLTDGPGNYDDSAECIWSIDAPGAAVTLVFSELDLEANYDFVKVYEGRTTGGTPLRGLTGTANSPVSVTSAGGHMTVVFATDSSVSATGFEAAYSSTEVIGPVPPAPPTLQSPPFTAQPSVHEDTAAPTITAQMKCSAQAQVVAAGSGELKLGASMYLPDAECQWLLVSAAGAAISLRFSQLELELGYDFVKIYDGDTTGSSLIGSYSGREIPPVATASSGAMLVVFTADGSGQGAGFEATFVVDETGLLGGRPDPPLEVQRKSGAMGRAVASDEAATWGVVGSAVVVLVGVALVAAGIVWARHRQTKRNRGRCEIELWPIELWPIELWPI